MADQPYLRVDIPCAASLHTDRPGQAAGAMALGAGLSSRLPAILRARLGWTYGVDVQTAPGRVASSIQVCCFVQEDAQDAALNIIREELMRLKQGITADELRSFCASSTVGFIEAFGTSPASTNFLCDYLRVGLLPDAIAARVPDFLELDLDTACDALSRLPVELMLTTTVLPGRSGAA